MAWLGQKYHDVALNALRIGAGLLFMTHGGQKLFGWFGAAAPADGVWPLGIAGLLEFSGGLMIAVGLFTWQIAFMVCGEMAVAYLWGHVARGGSPWPWVNRGELALLYGLIWLVIWTSGGGSWQVQIWWRKRGARAIGRVGARVYARVREYLPQRRRPAASRRS